MDWLKTSGSNSDLGRVTALNKAAPPNRRPRFALAALSKFDYCFCAQPPLSAAVGEPRRSSGTRSRKRRFLYKAGVILQNQGNAVRPAAQAATWSGGPDGVASGCHGRLVAAELSDARVWGKGYLATLDSCLKNPAVDLANLPANRQRAPKVIPTLLGMPLAETFAGHRSR